MSFIEKVFKFLTEITKSVILAGVITFAAIIALIILEIPLQVLSNIFGISFNFTLKADVPLVENNIFSNLCLFSCKGL